MNDTYTGLFEWNGEKPPTTHYNRAKAMGMSVRGYEVFARELGIEVDKAKEIGVKELRKMITISPMKLRQFEKLGTAKEYDTNIGGTYVDITFSQDGKENFSGTIAQEGAFISESKSLVRYVCGLAKKHGATLVLFSPTRYEEYFETTEDARIFNRIESNLSRSGRPKNGENLSYVVTCIEEGLTFQIDDVRYVNNCPSCNATNITIRVGMMIGGYKFDDSGVSDVFNAWRNHRFLFGSFEFPKNDPAGAVSNVYNCQDDRQKKAVESIEKSIEFLKRLQSANIDNEMKARMLDAVFLYRCYESPDVRQRKRIELCANVLKNRNVNQSSVNIIEPDYVDWVDCGYFEESIALNAFYALEYHKV